MFQRVEAKLLFLMTDAFVLICSNELCLLWKGDKYLRGKFPCLKRSSIGCKKFQRVHPEAFLTNFKFFWSIIVQAKLLLAIIDPSIGIGLNELLVSWNCKQYLRGKILHLKRSGIGCKEFKRVHAEPFLTNFQFFRSFSLSQTFTSF